jgi:hypothetical protein
MNWIRRAWRALRRAGEPEAPRRVNVREHPDALLAAFDDQAERVRIAEIETMEAIRAARDDRELDELAEQAERARAEINRRMLLRRAAALIATVGVIAREGLDHTFEMPGSRDAPRWDSRNSDPLADIMAARKRIEETVGVGQTVLLLGAGHRAYILAHFGLDIAHADTREELARELGMRVELAQPA